MFFDEIPQAPSDPIFGILSSFLHDPRPNKISLVVGKYLDDTLQAALLPVVARAKEEIYSQDQLADYLFIEGLPSFLQRITQLILSNDLASQTNHCSVQTVGGTSALRLAAELLLRNKTSSILLPDPTWANHHTLFQEAGCQVSSYPYYNHSLQKCDVPRMLSFFNKTAPKTAILLHASCHNPTGSDPSPQEWKELADLMKKRELFPVFDCAYQGLGEDIESDVASIRHFVREGIECMIAYSCSKNFSLYSQRTGALLVLSESQLLKDKILAQLKRIIRSIYSNPPAHGARIVAHILQQPSLYTHWVQEIAHMCRRIQKMRHLFLTELSHKIPARNWSPLFEHKGMFCFLNLTPAQTNSLKDNFAIYTPHDGRVSLAGINASNLLYIAESIANVLDLLP